MKCSSTSLMVPFRPSSKPVIEVGRIIQAVLVADQRRGHGADLQQPVAQQQFLVGFVLVPADIAVPVGVVAGQPGYLQAQHDPGAAHADLGDQTLKSLPIGGRGSRLALIGVDGDDPLDFPAQRDRLLPQRILAGGGFGVGQHLTQRGLAHIQIRGAGQVRTGHLRRGLLPHAHSLPCRDRERHRRQQPDQLGIDTCCDG